METQSLKPIITRYRPSTFEDFIGNESVVERLREALDRKSTRCFLISGPAGCGKTTLTRIIAQKIFCPEDIPLVREINAADHNTVDDLRDILEHTYFCGKKVFIFDEAHRLTPAAQSVALKFFEEPAGDSYFILCTNQPDKIQDALKSRCFSYEVLPLLSFETSRLLKGICEVEEKEVSKHTLDAIHEASRGIPRDALKMLEEAFARNNFITEKDNDRIFILQSKEDLDCFHFFSKDKPNYTSILMESSKHEIIRGKHVFIIQLKSHTGRHYSEIILKQIGVIAKDVKVLEMPGNDNKSFRDWVSNQPEGTDRTSLIKEFEALIEDPSELEFPSLRITPERLIMPFETFTKINFPRRRVIMSPWLEEGTITLLASPPGVGKTLFAMEIAAACSENRDAMGGLWPVEGAVPVLYLDGEMHWEDLNTRSKNIGLRKTLILSKMVYEFRNGSPPLNIADEEGIRNPLTSIILNQGTKLLILDNIYSLVIGLDHNFEREWSPINQWLISLRNKGVAVILVHHTGKKGDQLGTSSRKFNIDYSFTLEKRPLPGTDFGNCSFRIIVDKERRPVQNVRDKIFYLSDGKWNIDHLSEGESREAEYSNRKVAKLLVQGSRNKDIAKECDCTRANISQIKRRLCDRGLIIFDDESGIHEFTEKGEEWIQVPVN